MRTIPLSILEKIRKLQQTQAENADPRINLVMQRTKRYIEQGALMQPTDIWQRPGLGSLDMAIRRENHLTGPDKIFLIYIENGQAHVAWIDYLKSIEEKNEWEYLYCLGPAVDVAIEFDGRWHRTSPEAEVCFDAPALWTLVTFGEPYFFRILPGGSLVVQLGPGGAPVELAPSGVTKISAIRAWKNTYLWNHDQGLIAAYIRNGSVCYRNYAQQPPDMPVIWEPERIITELPSPAQDVAVFRTNDYRAGFVCEAGGEIHWAITERNWATMAIEPHTITGAIDLEVGFFQIAYVDIFTDEHRIDAAISLDVGRLLWGVAYNSFTSAINDGDTTIIAYCEHPLTTPAAADFRVWDENGDYFDVTAVQCGESYCELILTVESLNYSQPGDLTLKFLGSGDTKGEAGQAVDPFEITFTPEGLEYVEVNAPEVEAMWNE